MPLRRSARSTPTVLVAVTLGLTLAGGVAAVGVAGRAPAPGTALRADVAAEPLEPVRLEPPAEAATAPATEVADRVRPVQTRPSAPPPPVAALGGLRATDLVVTLPGRLSSSQVTALRAVRKVEAVEVLDTGTVRVAGRPARLLGVDPSTFRAFTPQATASSDALWQTVARGELAPDYGLQRAGKLVLGSTTTLRGRSDVERRIGAVAAYGLPGVDLVTDRATARAAGVAGVAVLISAPDRDIAPLRAAVRRVVGRGAEVQVLRAQVTPARSDRPRTYRELYMDSARYCPGLSWTVLAAIGQVESGHGRNLGPSSAGALGPMQFLPSTWAAYGVDGDRDGKADIMSPYDAVPSAASYLCRFGANRGPDGLYDAIFAYNHADWYVRKVLAIAEQYR